ncbi:E3 ubiquitin-protein ligase Midline-1 isoform X2 [Bombina bombina]|uniref:E3 ubiquitin-protein ligase Midline-1 isoform X2 n=1 Tax=Bombina bombina TaxID=8345 RepID=UPI00235AF594|nr:E3 ubiquitin-protein ligase Midline-1 isoform X2 [Bombina bombina]
MEASLTCAVCLGLFTEPVTLPKCSHNFCRTCVRDCVAPESRTVYSLPLDHGGASSWRTVCCPLCRKVSPLAGGVSSLPTNTTLAELVSLVTATREVKKENKETGGAVGSSSGTEFCFLTSCTEHPGKELQLYCKICAVSCCGSCVSERHQGYCHSVNLLDMVFQEEKLTLFSSFKKLREIHEKLTKEIDVTDIEALELKKQQLVDHIEYQRSTTMKEYRVWKQVKDDHRKTIESLLKDCENIVDEFEPQRFLKVACELNRRMSSSLDIMERSSDQRKKKQKWGPNCVDIQPALDAISALQITGSVPNDLFRKQNETLDGDFSFKTITRTWNNGNSSTCVKYLPTKELELDYVKGLMNKCNVCYKSICAMPEFKTTSCEELRLKYYENSVTSQNNVFSVPERKAPTVFKVFDKHMHPRRGRIKKVVKRQEGFDESNSQSVCASNIPTNIAHAENCKTKPQTSNAFPTAARNENAVSSREKKQSNKLQKCQQEGLVAASSNNLYGKVFKNNNDSGSGGTFFGPIVGLSERMFQFNKDNGKLVRNMEAAGRLKHDQNGDTCKNAATLFSLSVNGSTSLFKHNSTENEDSFGISIGNTVSTSNVHTATAPNTSGQLVNSAEVNEATDLSAHPSHSEEFFDANSNIDSDTETENDETISENHNFYRRSC